MSRFDDVQWFDNKDCQGHFVLEMNYKNGGRAYMKNESKEKIEFYYGLLQDCPDVLTAVIYNPAGKPLVTWAKAA